MIFHRYFHTFYKYYSFSLFCDWFYTNLTNIIQSKNCSFDISVAYLSNIMKSKYCNFIYNWDSIVVQWESSPTVYQVQFGKLFMYAWKEKKNSLIMIQGDFFWRVVLNSFSFFSYLTFLDNFFCIRIVDAWGFIK